MPPVIRDALAERNGDVRETAARLPASIEPVVRPYPQPLAGTLKELGQAIERYRTGSYALALAALPSDAAAAGTAVGDLVILYRAKARLALERSREALDDFRLLQKRYPESSQRGDAVLGEAQALLKLRDAAAAAAALANPLLEEDAETLYYRGRAREEMGDAAGARVLYLRVWSDFATSGASELAEQRLKAIAGAFLTAREGYEAALRRARNLLDAKKSSNARTLLARLATAAAPDSAAAERRLLLRGEAEYHLGRSTAALALVRRVSGADPERHAEALYLLGACYRRLERAAALLATRDEALRLHPKAAATEKLLYSVATYFDVEYRHDQARDAYRDIVTHFPKGDHAQRARWKVALAAYVRGDYGEALRGFWDYLFAEPEAGSASAPLYWIGRSAEKLGDLERAAYFYGHARVLAHDSYYGQLAKQAAARLRSAPISAAASISSADFAAISKLVESLRLPDTAIVPPSPPAAAMIERARQLVAAGLPEMALAELRWAGRRLPDNRALSFVMSRIHEMRDDIYGSIVTLRRAFPDYDDRPETALPGEIWQLLFPVRHLDAIVRNGRRYGIDPALVLALIRQESAFSETAQSSANARGLMQVLPRNGRALARKAGVPRYTTRKLYSPETNIALGVRHLHGLLERYDRKPELALAAYNAGEQRVERWLKEFGADDMAQFVEQIPFSETRGYVRQILTNVAHYRRLTSASLASAH